MTYSTDTRTLEPGQTYVAIRGETHDGHRFVAQAVAKGAAGVVIDRDVDVPAGPGGAAVGVTRVEDSVAWLVGRASEKVRASGARVVGITGSVGKTSTRAAVVPVLGEAFRVVASEGNRNTPLGLALTMLNREFGAESVLVMEMGARLPGDIAELARTFPPAVSVVTAVRGVHVETLGSIDGVEREKSSLVRALGPGGTACLNADDARVRRMAGVAAGRVLLWGAAEDADVRPDRITAALPILGEHAESVALAAFAVGVALGMDDAAINRGLGSVEPEKGRLARLPGVGGSVLIDDTYNASPDATRSALGVLAEQPGERHVAMLGDMLELGADEVEQHAEVLRAAAARADEVHCVGPLMAQAAAELPGAAAAKVRAWQSSNELADALRRGLVRIGKGTVSLVKGSQGTRMERVSEALLHPDEDPAASLPRQTEAWKQIE